MKGYIENDVILIEKAILNHKTNHFHDSFFSLAFLAQISNEECRKKLELYFNEVLENKFDGDLYFSLLNSKVISPTYKDYFSKYIDIINNSKGTGTYKSFDNEESRDYRFINFINLVYYLNIDRYANSFEIFNNLTDYFDWLLHYECFDYSKFKPEWLKIFCNKNYIKEFKKQPKIAEKLKDYLVDNYDKRLSEIYFKLIEKV